MKNKIILFAAFFLFSNLFITVLASENNIHPKFKLLNKTGNITSNINKISSIETCGQCHDTKYINTHNIHFNKKVKADCVVCHIKGSKISGFLKNLHTLIQLPSELNCLNCHGAGSDCLVSFKMPEDYIKHIGIGIQGKNYHLTQNTGEIISPVNISDSQMNIKNKKNLSYPWDVHARRQLKCISCHLTKNDPRVCSQLQTKTHGNLKHLKRDPRKMKTTSDYLKWPNHNLVVAKCQCCHDAKAVHNFLPFKERHLEKLECQSCHVPKIYGPAFQSIDKTTTTSLGNPLIELRGTDLSIDKRINTQYLKGYEPFLLSFKTANKSKVAPFNIVTEWFWVDKTTGKDIPYKKIKKIYQKKNKYYSDIIEIFDENKDKKLSDKELKLNSNKKINFIKLKLQTIGFKKPVIKGRIKFHKIIHSVASMQWTNRDCSKCHTELLGKDILLSANSPLGITPEIDPDSKINFDGSFLRELNGELLFQREKDIKDVYIFGYDRYLIVDIFGLFLLLLSIGALSIHAYLRYKGSKKYQDHHVEMKEVYMYSLYERIWHWAMAIAVIFLILTGLKIHYPGMLSPFSMESAVPLHNILGFILFINAALSLFYHITTGEIKQYFKVNKYFIQESILQIYYYAYNIFKRNPHPLAKSIERKLNPIQQVTYVGLLNILIPFQVLTGILIWLIGKYPETGNIFGGLNFLGPLHYIGSWLFIIFLFVHVYLITTGHTLISNFKAMITGYDEIESNHVTDTDEDGTKMIKMNIIDLIKKIINDIKENK